MSEKGTMKTKPGFPFPYGLSFHQTQVNFSLYAPKATCCELLIYSEQGVLHTTLTLDPKLHNSEGVWHISVEFAPLKGCCYLYRLNNVSLILDPYAKFLNTSRHWGQGAEVIKTKGVIRQPDEFDWESINAPNYRMQDLIIYELHTRGFTIQAPVKHPGTFLGLIEKIPYLKALGINAIELLPIHEFNECELPTKGLYNYWGYSPIAYFAFMNRYSAHEGDVLNEFKTLVKELHRAKIALIIDVVYNHTAEGGSKGPCYHFKQLDHDYYLRDDKGQLIDMSGCGNTLNANAYPSFHLILESLLYLAVECHVDGFRFDLASTFYRSSHGVLSHPRIMEALLDHPILSKKLLIAEAWDAHGLYQVGSFPKPFADWNGAYRDKLRAFINQQPGSKGAFADALSGTCSLYFNKTPDLSINFITAHDGFTLYDLFSYNQKHNLNNGEHNADGSNHNLSYNWGHEGPSDDPNLIQIRTKLMNFSLALLMLSLGTPMILMGDEYGHTKQGNNNTYCQDNKLNYFLWDQVNEHNIAFIKSLIHLRSHISRLKVPLFYEKHELSWHGLKFDDPAWESNDYFLIAHLHTGFIFIINASSQTRQAHLPQGSWKQIFSSAPSQKKPPHPIDNNLYTIGAHELSVLEISP